MALTLTYRKTQTQFRTVRATVKMLEMPHISSARMKCVDAFLRGIVTTHTMSPNLVQTNWRRWRWRWQRRRRGRWQCRMENEKIGSIRMEICSIFLLLLLDFVLSEASASKSNWIKLSALAKLDDGLNVMNNFGANPLVVPSHSFKQMPTWVDHFF